jgi:hypothetical protein
MMPSPVVEPQECNKIQAKIAVAQATTTIDGDDGADHHYQSDTNSNALMSITSSICDYNFE